MADTRTSASRRAAANSSTTRLPSARERRPALAALAVLLIVGGAFASGFLALQAGNRADYLRVKSGADIPQGAEIRDDDLESVSLPEDMDGVISVDDQDDVVGLRAVTRLVEGTILTDNMVTSDSGVEPGMEEVPLNVENVTPGLTSGDSVRVHTAPDEGSPADYEAEVLSAFYPEDDDAIGGGSSSDSVVSLTVLMTDDDAAEIAPAIRDDDVAYVARVAPSDDSNGGE
jgi:SAF domain